MCAVARRVAPVPVAWLAVFQDSSRDADHEGLGTARAGRRQEGPPGDGWGRAETSHSLSAESLSALSLAGRAVSARASARSTTQSQRLSDAFWYAPAIHAGSPARAQL